jgi:hypothetical protein
MAAGPVFILTGFPIAAAGVGETDGPSGAANIARALGRLGIEAHLITDARSIALVEAAAAVYAPEARCHCIPDGDAGAAGLALLHQCAPTHLIAIERPGRHGGHYYSAKGVILDDLVADTDALYAAFDGVKIAIGDGGNELGTGSLRDVTLAVVPGGAEICADLGSDFALAAGVSNWWGWGIAALLSVAAGRDLMPSDAEEAALLAAVVAAGGVDGMAFVPQMTVDGLSLEANLAMLRDIRALVSETLAGRLDSLSESQHHMRRIMHPHMPGFDVPVAHG